MPSPTEVPPASDAPLFAASMTPGPPPVMTAKPASTSWRPRDSASPYDGSSGVVRADPNTEIAGPSSASAPKPSTNSLWIRSTRHGSVWTQSPEPLLSSSRWSVVVAGTIAPRNVIGPVWCSGGPLDVSGWTAGTKAGSAGVASMPPRLSARAPTRRLCSSAAGSRRRFRLAQPAGREHEADDDAGDQAPERRAHAEHRQPG